MTKYHNKKENDAEEVKVIGETKNNEEVLKFEQALKEDKLALAKNESSGGSIKKSVDKISLVLVIVLLLLSIVQSVELFSLRNQITKGQFTTAGASVPAAGGSALPAQQGGC